MTVSIFRRQWLVGAVALAASTMAWAAGPLNLNSSGVAIHGHDPVAYFVDGRPVMGRAELRHAVNGATYWFANDSNLQAFKADPPKYEPQATAPTGWPRATSPTSTRRLSRSSTASCT